jgi:hypothetical protein
VLPDMIFYRISILKGKKYQFRLSNYLLAYCISADSFCGNYSFLNLTLCTVTFVHSTNRCGNYSREETTYSRAETIRGNTVSIFYEQAPKFN